MEKNKDEFDDIFKDKFDDFEPEVEPKVWKNVKTAIKWGGVGLLIKYLINKLGTNTIVALVSSAITVVSTVWVMDNKKQSDFSNNDVNRKVVVETKEQKVDEGQIIAKTTETTVEEEEKVVEIKPAIKTNKKSNTRSFKNTEVKEVTTDLNKVKSVISTLSKQSVAIISATPISGTAPLIVNLTNVGSGSKNEWIFNDGQPTTTEVNPARAFLAGKHTIILKSTTEDGKVAIDSVQITVTDVSSLKPMDANSFSPDGDGIADVFSFQSRNMVSMQAEIYDKNSNLVYKWKGTDGYWDGKTLKGEDAPSGLYFYIITAEGIDGKRYEQKAVVRLIR